MQMSSDISRILFVTHYCVLVELFQSKYCLRYGA